MSGKGKDMYSKMTKTTILAGSKQLKRYIPATKRMTKKTLRTMLQKKRMVYIKPCRGSLGRGVIKVGIGRGNKYYFQKGVRKRRFTSFARMYRTIRKTIGNKPYLVQRGIRLLTYRGLIFDIRVMVQRNAQRKWKVTGMAGRVAHPRKAVTNGSQGGSIYPVGTLLKPYLGKKKRTAKLAAIARIGVQSAKRLGPYLPGKNEIGADIALDRRMKPWILEVNWNPDPCPFTKLKNRRMLLKILRFARIHGKTYRLRCNKAKRGR